MYRGLSFDKFLVTGIDGTFKVTSIRVMEVLRENRDSLLAALEAFIYDPLLNWRLLDSFFVFNR